MMKRKDSIAVADWGLFEHNPILHPLKFIEDCRLYRLRKRFIKQYGITEPAFWLTDEWCIDVFKKIIKRYREKRFYVITVSDKYNLANDDELALANQETNEYFDRMLLLLDQMDESFYYDIKIDPNEKVKRKEQCKDEFFIMFSKIFYKLSE